MASLDSASRSSAAQNIANKKYVKALSDILQPKKPEILNTAATSLKPSYDFTKTVVAYKDAGEDLSILAGEVCDYVEKIRAYSFKLNEKSDGLSSASSVIDDLNSTVELVISGSLQKSGKNPDVSLETKPPLLDLGLDQGCGDLLAQAQSAALKQLKEDGDIEDKASLLPSAGACQTPCNQDGIADIPETEKINGVRVNKIREFPFGPSGASDKPVVLKNIVSLNEAVSAVLQQEPNHSNVIKSELKIFRRYPIALQNALDALDKADKSHDEEQSYAVKKDNEQSDAAKALVVNNSADLRAQASAEDALPEEDFDEEDLESDQDREELEDNERFAVDAVQGEDFDYSKTLASRSESFKEDGNPEKLRASDRQALEQYRLRENQELGRRLDSHDFYDDVKAKDPWLQDILSAGFKDGPAYSALSCSHRVIDPNNPNLWTLEMSADFALLINDKSFCKNLALSFSRLKKHPVEISIVTKQGIPEGCPEDLARKEYVAAIDSARKELSADPKIVEFLNHLGEDITTVNLGLYTQKQLVSK